jgi:Holliday junction resolvase RusA-like endonuclease
MPGRAPRSIKTSSARAGSQSSALDASRYAFQVPDVENIPKRIVDAFTGLLYPDDNLHRVPGVQVETEWGPDAQQRTEIWI